MEGLRQMSAVTAPTPASYTEVQQRWSSAQAVSTSIQNRALLASPIAPARREVEVAVQDADEEEVQALSEVTRVIGGADGDAVVAARMDDGQMEVWLNQLRLEPQNDEESAAKFQLYEGYSTQVEQMRKSLVDFHTECRPTLPEKVGVDMDKKVKGIDDAQSMGIYDEAREWFVFQMMRQAEKNNVKMAKILEGFETTLKFMRQNDQQECPVCLEPFQESGSHSPETLGCCHKVCKDCWAHWETVMNGRAFCPLCRHDEFLGAVAARVASPFTEAA